MVLSKKGFALLCVLLLAVAAALALVWYTMYRPFTVQVTLPENIDMSLDTELAQAGQVLDAFPQPVSDTEPVEIAEADAAPFIPAGCRYLSGDASVGSIYLTYQLDGVRYTVVYYQTGNVQKVAYALGGNMIYSIDSETMTVEATEAMQRV